MKLWLDDIRPMPEGFDVHVKRVSHAIALIEMVTTISFDHDLGEGRRTGYDLAKFIEKGAYDGSVERITYSVHSANPVGRKNIVIAMENAEEYWNVWQEQENEDETICY